MDPLRDGWLWWAIAIGVGIPILLVVLTEILGALVRRGSPAAKPVRLLRNWVVPVGALLAVLAFASLSPADLVWVRVVATVFGFLLILLLLSALNVSMFGNAREGSWQQRIPQIFVQIAQLILIVVGLALLFQWVWGADVGGLIAALGVTSIVIGLALQNAVGGVISGLLLLFEQPFKIGDWLDTGSVQGRVIEVNWRAVHIDTGSGIQIVPNSTLSGASFTNKSLPAGPFSATTTVKFTTDDPPHEVVALLAEVAKSLPMRIPDEPAGAEYLGGGVYTVTLPIQGPDLEQRALSLFLSWLWYAARRRGLALDGDATDPIAEPGRLEEALDIVGPTLQLGAEDRDRVLASSRLARYGVGEIVIPAGVVPDEISFIVQGRARFTAEAGGGRLDVATAEPGDYVGQTALTREKATLTVVAADVLTVLVMPLSTVDELVRTRPRLASEISASIDLRRKQAADAVASAGAAAGTMQLR
ncbi:mechanosensitive ion channel [Microbacterium jejuense]|uniref:Mechanosensitive ion channel n=1 Tax=Microbacterium jejuense TaxID=1263637 RepID=A0ABS7HNH9_9MICO|nr:mechanosensitive ion channel family protein [Microbacterium jejuense]MBW9094280.1 mechanosensitive ion channel [Microbacterium jejuense]